MIRWVNGLMILEGSTEDFIIGAVMCLATLNKLVDQTLKNSITNIMEFHRKASSTSASHQSSNLEIQVLAMPRSSHKLNSAHHSLLSH